ncbi:MAG TPA: hypothetical protein VEA16_11165 [Vicinamibacterales bacterium]|nr:hypothetical protein [Vicinamibacterales bacterium]
MTTADDQREFAQWAQQWQAAAPQDVSTAEQIRHYVKRRGGLVWSFVVTDFVIGGIALPILLYFGVMTTSDVQRFAMFSLASMTVAAVGFGWWNWRGVLRASAASVSDHIAISAERIRRMRLALRVAWLLLAAEDIVFTVWIWNRLYSDGPPAAGAALFTWTWLIGFSLVAVAGLVFFGRWLERDAARFEAMRQELERGIDERR